MYGGKKKICKAENDGISLLSSATMQSLSHLIVMTKSQDPEYERIRFWCDEICWVISEQFFLVYLMILADDMPELLRI